MDRLRKHLRNTFLAGIFAAIPIVITVFVIWWIDNKTSIFTHWLMPQRNIPFLGIVIALLAIYLMGLVTTSLLGQMLLGYLDRFLARIPFLSGLYAAWKQVSLTPGGKEGTWGKVVLVPVETGNLRALGFTSGEGIPGNADLLCVLLPGVPNPINGRMYFVRRSDCLFLNLSPEEAFKIILSTGNYVPPQIAEAMNQPALLESK